MTNKLEKLTQEQEALMPVIAKKWIDKVDNPEPFDAEKATKAVEWLYEFSGLTKPEVLIFDSPIGVQLGLNTLQTNLESVRNSVRNSVIGSVNDSVENSVGDSVWVSVWVSVRDSVIGSVNDSVENSVGNSVRVSVNDSVENSDKLEFFAPCLYGDIWDYQWTAFYDYFDQIGVLDHKNFRAWRDYCESGIFYAVQLDGLCAISKMPKYIKRNNEGQMHCEDGYAIEFHDGWGIYVLDGIRFDRKGQEDLYWKIVKHELTLPEILQIEDIDQRAIALKYCNAEKIIQELEKNGQAELVDEAQKPSKYLDQSSIYNNKGELDLSNAQYIENTLTYKMYKVTIPSVFDEAEYMIVYPHASIDGLSYWKGTHPDDAKKGVMYAIAKSHNSGLDEYTNINQQS